MTLLYLNHTTGEGREIDPLYFHGYARRNINRHIKHALKNGEKFSFGLFDPIKCEYVHVQNVNF